MLHHRNESYILILTVNIHINSEWLKVVQGMNPLGLYSRLLYFKIKSLIQAFNYLGYSARYFTYINVFTDSI